MYVIFLGQTSPSHRVGLHQHVSGPSVSMPSDIGSPSDQPDSSTSALLETSDDSSSESSSQPPSQTRTRSRGRGRGRGRGGRGRGRGTGTPRGQGRGVARGRGRGRATGRGHPSPSMESLCSPPSSMTNDSPSGSDSDTRLLKRKWMMREPNQTIYTYTGGAAGPTTPVNTSMSALELFSRFFTDEVWDLIVTETNRYARSGYSKPHPTLGHGMM